MKTCKPHDSKPFCEENNGARSRPWTRLHRQAVARLLYLEQSFINTIAHSAHTQQLLYPVCKSHVSSLRLFALLVEEGHNNMPSHVNSKTMEELRKKFLVSGYRKMLQVPSPLAKTTIAEGTRSVSEAVAGCNAA